MISVTGLNMEWGTFALRDVNLEVPSGEYMVMVGPTGSGKTLLLETIAGLHRVRSGEIRLDGRDVTKEAPEERGIAMVYQDYALFPHLSVADNIAFGLKRRRRVPAETLRRVDEVAGMVGVGHLLRRKPGRLSGGEKQRVALARALAVSPRLLLLDEPVSALDPETRETLLGELKRIHDAWHITAVHVTHDLNEALMLGGRIAVMGEGSIRQVGRAEEVLRRPVSEFVARFTMTRNIFPARFVRKQGDLSFYEVGGIEIASAVFDAAAGHVSARAEDLDILGVQEQDAPTGKTNHLAGIVSKIEDRGGSCLVTVHTPLDLCCLVGARELRMKGIRIGQQVNISFDPALVHAF
jgi:ABC-type Fe3+/spermidine/putrescine transport system ATPase subunit